MALRIAKPRRVKTETSRRAYLNLGIGSESMILLNVSVDLPPSYMIAPMCATYFS
jgi:hypothetical protein